MKAKRSSYGGVIALLVIGAAGVYGLGVYLAKTPEAAEVATDLRRADAREKQPAKKNEPSQESATILTPKSSGGELSFESATEAVPDGTNPLVFAVNRYLQNSNVMPPAARVLSVEVKEGTAYFDCTEAMDTTFGSSDEQTLLQGIGRTLQQFPDVRRFQFLVSGKPIETWGGVDMTEPLDVTPEGDSSTTPEA